jgi:threonine synthase
VSWLSDEAVERIVVDSSGNASASLAAYSARAGLTCDVYVPAHTSSSKIAQAVVYGASIRLVDGARDTATDYAIAAAQDGAVYASHMWNPLFHAGTQTVAFELWEQLGHTAPDAVVIPVGSGSLLLGVVLGFQALASARLVGHTPRFYGIQSKASAPLALAFAAGESRPAHVVAAPGDAEGLLVTRPPRGSEILQKVRASGGAIISIDDQTLWRSFYELGRAGLYVEPTSALAVAGFDALVLSGALEPTARTVVILTGSGLKATAHLPNQHLEAVGST